jgi:hypothetical protein
MDTTKIWTKPQTQQTLKMVRKAGYDVIKEHFGYEVKIPSSERVVMRALNGRNTYIVRYDSGLFIQV